MNAPSESAKREIDLLPHPVDAAHRLVYDFELHSPDSDRANISALFDILVPVYVDLRPMRGALGYGLFPPGRISLDNPAEIRIERQLPEQKRRQVYGHEIGHYLCKHQSSAFTWGLSSWHYQHDEREAWIAASIMLIPGHLMLMGYSEEEIAGRAGVPAQLVQIYKRAVLYGM